MQWKQVEFFLHVLLCPTFQNFICLGIFLYKLFLYPRGWRSCQQGNGRFPSPVLSGNEIKILIANPDLHGTDGTIKRARK